MSDMKVFIYYVGPGLATRYLQISHPRVIGGLGGRERFHNVFTNLSCKAFAKLARGRSQSIHKIIRKAPTRAFAKLSQGRSQSFHKSVHKAFTRTFTKLSEEHAQSSRKDVHKTLTSSLARSAAILSAQPHGPDYLVRGLSLYIHIYTSLQI